MPNPCSVLLCVQMSTPAKHVPDSTTMTIRLDRSVKERLEAVAGRMNRSKSYLAGVAIEEYLAAQEWQIEGIKRALHSLDEGRGVAHEDVVAWVESWGTDDELPKPKV